MVQNALDETLRQTKQLFILYDDCGSLTLKNINSLKTDQGYHNGASGPNIRTAKSVLYSQLPGFLIV